MAAIVEALPLRPGTRVLEIGCGPGVAAVEAFERQPGEAPFDLALAVRVGALDGRHPELWERALRSIARALAPGGRLFVDGGDPLREVALPRPAAARRP